MDEQKCTACDNIKPVDCFQPTNKNEKRNKRRRELYRTDPEWRAREREYGRRYRQRKRAKAEAERARNREAKESRTHLVCRICKETKAASSIRRSRGRLTNTCKDCAKAQKNKSRNERWRSDPEYRAKELQRWSDWARKTKRSSRRRAKDPEADNAAKRERRKKKAEREGRVFRPWQKNPMSEWDRAQAALAKKNARQAWEWWLDHCPTTWLEEYSPRLAMYRAEREAGKSHDAADYKARYHTNPGYRAFERTRNQFKKWLRGQRQETPSFLSSLDYTREELRTHIEKQFAPGMHWGNAGDWHIDHIIPKSSFDPRNAGDVRACWALSNLRPIWGKENRVKHAKLLFLL